tara:strand:- start:6556 stop:7344 length:789 start_codon:yes stop_codon:yes gene_type:complete
MNKKYFVPPIILDLIRFSRSLKFRISSRKILKQNLAFKDKYKDEDVFIIGNGPSLDLNYFDTLKDKNLITMNDFHKSDFSKSLKIIAHCSGEPHSSNAWTDPSDMIENVNADSFWFNIFDYKKMSGINTIYKDINYVNPGFESTAFSKKIELDKTCFGYETSAQLAIQVAIYMGFKNIYLLGFDHDWLASPQYSKHFYSDAKQDNDMIHQKSYLELISMCHRIWSIYFNLKVCAELKSAKIYNLSKNSFLDVFPVLDFNDVA